MHGLFVAGKDPAQDWRSTLYQCLWLLLISLESSAWSYFVRKTLWNWEVILDSLALWTITLDLGCWEWTTCTLPVGSVISESVQELWGGASGVLPIFLLLQTRMEKDCDSLGRRWGFMDPGIVQKSNSCKAHIKNNRQLEPISRPNDQKDVKRG